VVFDAGATNLTYISLSRRSIQNKGSNNKGRIEVTGPEEILRERWW